MWAFVIGDSASQALAEFLSVLLAVVVWKRRTATPPRFAATPRPPFSCGRARRQITNHELSAAELVSCSEIMSIRDADVLRLLGALNKSADRLSRRVEPGKAEEPEPDCLNGVRRRAVPDRCSDLFSLPLPTSGSKMGLSQLKEDFSRAFRE